MKEQRLTAIAQKAVSKSDMEVKEIAPELDLRPSTVYQKLNPYDENGFLGLDDAHQIMLMINDTSVLKAMALDFGYGLHKIGECPPDGADMLDEVSQLVEASNMLVQAANKGIPYERVSPLLERVRKEAEDIFVRLRDEQKSKPRVHDIKQAG
jgi:hypothetical protein